MALTRSSWQPVRRQCFRPFSSRVTPSRPRAQDPESRASQRQYSLVVGFVEVRSSTGNRQVLCDPRSEHFASSGRPCLANRSLRVSPRSVSGGVRRARPAGRGARRQPRGPGRGGADRGVRRHGPGVRRGDAGRRRGRGRALQLGRPRGRQRGQGPDGQHGRGDGHLAAGADQRSGHRGAVVRAHGGRLPDGHARRGAEGRHAIPGGGVESGRQRGPGEPTAPGQRGRSRRAGDSRASTTPGRRRGPKCGRRSRRGARRR